MNQLINKDNLTLEEVRKIREELFEKELSLLGKELLRVDQEHKETKFVVIKHDQKIESVESKTDYLENNMIIHTKQGQQLANLAKLKWLECLGGKDAPAYKTHYAALRSNFWGRFKQIFQLVSHENGGSYKDLRSKDFDKAKEWIKNYKMAEWLQEEVDQANNQIKMEI